MTSARLSSNSCLRMARRFTQERKLLNPFHVVKGIGLDVEPGERLRDA